MELHHVFQHILVVGDLSLEALLVIGGGGQIDLDTAQLQLQSGLYGLVLFLLDLCPFLSSLSDLIHHQHIKDSEMIPVLNPKS